MMNLHKIKETFDWQFQQWDIALPEEDLQVGRRGTIHKNRWTINYSLGEENGLPYLEYFACHRMTNDTLHRINADGQDELIGYCQEFYTAGDVQAEQEYLEHNRKFYQTVSEKGLM